MNQTVEKEKPETIRKMGFDFRYFISCRCSLCGAYFTQSSDLLYISQCPDCRPERYGISVDD